LSYQLLLQQIFFLTITSANFGHFGKMFFVESILAFQTQQIGVETKSFGAEEGVVISRNGEESN
jgi:hypothetical protein